MSRIEAALRRISLSGLSLVLAAAVAPPLTAQLAPEGQDEVKPTVITTAVPLGTEVAKPTAEAVAEVRGWPLSEGWEQEEAARRAYREPLDGTWWLDDNGQAYFLSRYPKAAGWSRYESPWTKDKEMVRTADGEIYELAAQDEELLYLKIYRPSRHRPDPEAEAREREEMARLAASYRVSIPASDRLRLTPFSDGLPQRGMWRNGFDVADMNGDGWPDIVHGPPRRQFRNEPLVFLGDGAGSWKLWDARYPRFPYDYGDAAAADLNGDGHNDIVLGIHLRGVVAMVADGEGGFELWNEGLEFHAPAPGDSVGSEAAVFSSRTLTTADWNGDGRVDIVALGEGPRPSLDNFERTGRLFDYTSFGLRVYLNQGDGTWRISDMDPEERRIFGDAVALGDFDADDEVEGFISTSVINLDELLVDRDGVGNPEPRRVPGVRPMAFVKAVAAADFDGDGRDDAALAWVNREPDMWRSGIDLLYSRPDGWERRPVTMREDLYAWTALGTGDLDGDGAVDLVALDRRGTTTLFLGDGAGFLVQEDSPEITSPGKECVGYHVMLVDLDGDGRDEIVEEFAGEREAMFAPDRCLSGGALRAWDATPDPPSSSITASD